MHNKTFLIFFNTTWDWPADYCRQTAEEVSKTNNTICYLGEEPVSFFSVCFKKIKIWEKVHQKLWRYRPIEFPLRRFSWTVTLQQRFNIRLFQAYVRQVTSTEQPVIAWIFDQMYGPLVRFFPRSWKILYDCVDYVWDPDPQVNKKIQNNENILIQKATWMTVNSQTLALLHETKRQDITVVPLGFRNEVFHKFRHIHIKENSRSTTIGFVGVLDYRIDYDLIKKLAKHHPEWKIVLYGSVHDDYNTHYRVSDCVSALARIPNVSVRDAVVDSRVPSVISRFDICMIPYRMDIPFNKYSYPMKLVEYFYMGKPVISTKIQELKQFPRFVKISDKVSEWESYITDIVTNGWSKTRQQEERHIAEYNSWEQKISTIITLMS